MDASSAKIQPLEREQRLYERVAQQILDLIKQDTWQAGDRLPTERELADAFNVSRTVIREAVKFLEAQGWLRVTTGSGIYVQNPSSELVSRSLETYLELSGPNEYPQQLIEIRRILEIEMAGLAAERATDVQVARLTTYCQQMRASLTERDRLADLDFQLHTLLAEATQNELFKVLLAPLIDQLHDIFQQTWAAYGDRPIERIFQQHEAIVTAVANHDPQAARDAMIAHMDYSAEVTSESVARRR